MAKSPDEQIAELRAEVYELCGLVEHILMVIEEMEDAGMSQEQILKKLREATRAIDEQFLITYREAEP